MKVTMCGGLEEGVYMPIHVCGRQSQESAVVGLAWVKGHLCGCGASRAVSDSPA